MSAPGRFRKFGDIEVGTAFECWGDYHLNYDHPKWCQCVKYSENSGKEVRPDGHSILFLMDKHDEVWVPEKYC